MIVGVAIAVALACILASARRLVFAAEPTAFHPDDVVELLGRGDDPVARLRAAAHASPEADWERELVAALEAPSSDTRAALVNEQLTELDHRLERWARVPRVCASIATSVGMLLGTLVLRNALAESEVIDETFVMRIVGDAISVVAFGIVGTAFCIAAHTRARRLTRTRLTATDKMIEALEQLASARTTPS